MPDKASVAVALRIVREDGAEELAAVGVLHRLRTAWALTCRIAKHRDEAGDGSDITLIVREGEIRMNRKGGVNQEQLFRTGEWSQGTIGTLYGSLAAEAWTNRIQFGLSLSGGTVEWDYEMRVGDQDFGRSSITLDIREEQQK